MYKKKYSVAEFSELIRTEAYHEITYVVEGFIFISNSKDFDRVNKKPLNQEKLIEFEDLAEKHKKPLMIVWLGDDRHTRVLQYLGFKQKK